MDLHQYSTHNQRFETNKMDRRESDSPRPMLRVLDRILTAQTEYLKSVNEQLDKLIRVL